MAKIDEHSVILRTEHGNLHAYVCGDDDDGTPDWRLSLVTSNGTTWVDMPPSELVKIANLIRDSLQDEGFCEHGVAFDGSYCAGCVSKEPPQPQLCWD